MKSLREYIKRTLKNKANKTIKRNRIRNHKRYLSFLDKKFPKCETCGIRTKFGSNCANCQHNTEEQEAENALHLQESR